MIYYQNDFQEINKHQDWKKKIAFQKEKKSQPPTTTLKKTKLRIVYQENARPFNLVADHSNE